MDQRQQLRWWFDQIDLNRSGELDARELQQALALGGLVFGLSDVVSSGRSARGWC
jgi:Ca2+-binding EF-hand superfamily protein